MNRHVRSSQDNSHTEGQRRFLAARLILAGQSEPLLELSTEKTKPTRCYRENRERCKSSSWTSSVAATSDLRWLPASGPGARAPHRRRAEIAEWQAHLPRGPPRVLDVRHLRFRDEKTSGSKGEGCASLKEAGVLQLVQRYSSRKLTVLVRPGSTFASRRRLRPSPSSAAYRVTTCRIPARSLNTMGSS